MKKITIDEFLKQEFEKKGFFDKKTIEESLNNNSKKEYTFDEFIDMCIKKFDGYIDELRNNNNGTSD